MRKIVTSGIIGILIAILIISIVQVMAPRDQYLVEDESKDITKIYFMSSWAGVDSKSVIIDTLIRQFNKDHPDIEVIDMSLAGEDFLYTLKTGFASNEPPDVFGLWPGSDLDVLIEKGKIANLRTDMDFDPSWENGFDETVYNNFMSEESLYSIPFEMIYEGLFINEKLFDKYRVKKPKTIEELYVVVRSFRNRGVVPIAFNATPEGSFLIQNLMVASKGKFTPTYVESAIDGDDFLLQEKLLSAAGEAIDIVENLEKMKAFPNDYAVLDDYGRNQLFRNGKAAMIFQGSWFLDQELLENQDVGFLATPKLNADDPSRVIYGIGNGNFHISQNAYNDQKKREASLKFLKFLTSAESAKSFSILPGFTSSLKASDAYLSGVGKESLNTVRNADILSVPVDHVVDRSLWETMFVGNLVSYLEGELNKEVYLKSTFVQDQSEEEESLDKEHQLDKQNQLDEHNQTMKQAPPEEGSED